MELCDVTGRVSDRLGLQSVALGNDAPVGFITGGAPHRMWLHYSNFKRREAVWRKVAMEGGIDVPGCGNMTILHGDVVLAAVESVTLGDGEEPAGDRRVLWDVELLQPHAAIPAVLGQLLSRFG